MKPSTPPSLKDLALDHLGRLAADLRKADPSLSREQSVAKAAQTPAGRSSYALYRMEGSDQAWPEAVRAILESRATSKAARKARASRKVSVGPADALYAKIVEQAVAAAAPGRSEPGAVADYLQTSAGQTLWRQYNAARQVEDE